MRTLNVKNRVLYALFAGVVLALVLAACSDGSASSGGGSESSAGQGTLEVQLTDAPSDAVSAVNVHIVGLKIKPSNGPVQELAFPGATVNLLALQNRQQRLTLEQVPADSYQFMQVQLDEGQSNVVVNGDVLPLKIPSQEIKVLGGFDVFEDGQTTVLLDFDAHQSLIQQGNGQWLLKPVILMAAVSAS